MQREFATQIRNFSGLRWGNITPTDIDGCVDYHNKAWVLFELKYNGAELPFGQGLALERQCDDLQRVKPTLLIIASHTNEPPADIDAENAIVVKYRYNHKWTELENGKTVKAMLDEFFNWIDNTPA